MIKVASIQYWINDEKSKEERTAHIESMIDQAAGAQLIVLPEVWNIGWRCFDQYAQGSETLEGETVSRIAAKARKLGAYVLAGTIIERDGEDLYNTAVLLDPKGRVIASYRKIHLVIRKGSEEYTHIKAGKEIVSVATELGTIGIGICYDIRFPELYRKMAVQRGVEIFLQPAAWPLVRVENWIHMNCVRANENLAYMISCNCAGINRGVQYLGHSMVADPHGVPVASAGLFEGIVKAEIDVEELRKIRKDVGHLQNIVLPV